jgi:hypothetical protein
MSISYFRGKIEIPYMANIPVPVPTSSTLYQEIIRKFLDNGFEGGGGGGRST